jgi:hypothetical protein
MQRFFAVLGAVFVLLIGYAAQSIGEASSRLKDAQAQNQVFVEHLLADLSARWSHDDVKDVCRRNFRGTLKVLKARRSFNKFRVSDVSKAAVSRSAQTTI